MVNAPEILQEAQNNAAAGRRYDSFSQSNTLTQLVQITALDIVSRRSDLAEVVVSATSLLHQKFDGWEHLAPQSLNACVHAVVSYVHEGTKTNKQRQNEEHAKDLMDSVCRLTRVESGSSSSSSLTPT